MPLTTQERDEVRRALAPCDEPATAYIWPELRPLSAFVEIRVTATDVRFWSSKTGTHTLTRCDDRGAPAELARVLAHADGFLANQES